MRPGWAKGNGRIVRHVRVAGGFIIVWFSGFTEVDFMAAETCGKNSFRVAKWNGA